MTAKAIRAKALLLPAAERLTLVQELWDSIAQEPQSIELSAAEKRLLDQRVEADARNPRAAKPWSVVKRRALAKVKAMRFSGTK